MKYISCRGELIKWSNIAGQNHYWENPFHPKNHAEKKSIVNGYRQRMLKPNTNQFFQNR